MKPLEKLLIGAIGVIFVAGAALAVAKPGNLGDEDAAPENTTTTIGDTTTTTVGDNTTTTAPESTTTTEPETMTTLAGGDEGTDVGTADSGTDSTTTSETPTSETPTSETPTTETPTTQTPTTETPTTTGTDSGVGSTTDGNVGTENGTADTGMENMAGPGLVLLGAALGLSRLGRKRRA